MPTSIPQNDNEPISGRVSELTLWLDTIRKRSPVAKIELVKVGYAEIIMTWSTEGVSEVAELAGEILKLAEQEGAISASASGKCVFRLRAIDGLSQSFAAKTFSVASAPAGSGVEGPTDLGTAFTSVLKAYNELCMIVTRAFAGRDDAWQKQNELLLSQNIQLRSEHFDVLRQWQKHVVLESEQKRLNAQLAREEKRDEFMMEKMETIVPLIANRLGGGGHGRGAPAAGAILDAVFSRFTPAQMEALMGPMSPLDDQQKYLLSELFESFMKRKVTPLNTEANGAANGKEVS